MCIQNLGQTLHLIYSIIGTSIESWAIMCRIYRYIIYVTWFRYCVAKLYPVITHTIAWLFAVARYLKILPQLLHGRLASSPPAVCLCLMWLIREDLCFITRVKVYEVSHRPRAPRKWYWPRVFLHFTVLCIVHYWFYLFAHPSQNQVLLPLLSMIKDASLARCGHR